MAGEACEPLGSRAPQLQHQQSPRDSVQEESKESDVEQDHVGIVSTTLAPDPIFAEILANPPEPPSAESWDFEQGDAGIFVTAAPDDRIDAPSDFEQGDAKFHVLDSEPTTPINQTAAHNTDLSPYPRSDSPLPTSGTTKIVRTKLCHPVKFDYIDQTHDGSDPCHFCNRAAYSVIGLVEKTVEVIEWDDGSGWEEIRGGHRSEGTEPTQVCPQCTLARMRIMVCGDHALRPIAGADDKQDLWEATERLVEQDVMDMWCSVCCNMAAWECCSAQQVETGEGCGLALCNLCVVDLRKCNGSFEKMLQKLEDELGDETAPDRLLGLRADYALLKLDGLLMGHLRSSA